MIELYNGDCIELLKTIPDKSIDLIATDIPYGVINRSDNGLMNLNKGKADIVTFDIKNLVNQFERITKGSIYIFCSTEQISEIRTLLINAGMSTRVIVWEKTNPAPMNGEKIWLSGIELCVYGKFKKATFNEHCKNTVLRYPKGNSKVHPTQKPIKLFEKIILASSNENDVVLDPFMGSGTTGIACVNTGRNFIGMEIDQNYFNIAKERIENAKKNIIENEQYSLFDGS